MSDKITIDIALLQSVFGDLQRVQQAISGVSGGVSVMDANVAKSTGNINRNFQSVNDALGGVGTTADRTMGGMVQDLLGPIARTQELETKLRDLNARMTTTRSVREMSALKKEAAAVQAEINRIDGRGMEQRVAGPTSNLRSMFGGMVAPLAGAFAVSGVLAFGSGVVQAAAGAQAYSTSLEVMLQNKAAADAMVAQVKEFAATTPFELPQVQAASQQLLAFGFDSQKIVPQLTVLGNVASALNQPVGDIAYLFGTARVQGRLYTNDLMQFMNRGIPIVSELSKVMGVSEAKVKELTEKGKVGFKELEQAMNNLGGAGGRFDGLMDRQSKTIGGTLSNLSDSWGQFKADLGLSLAPMISSGIGMLQDALGGVRGAMEWVQDNGPLVKGVLIAVGGAVGIYTLALVTNSAAAFVAAFQSGGLVAALGLQAIVTNTVTAATALWEVAQWAINAALTANPIGLIIVAIGALIAAVVYLVNHWDAATAYLGGMWESWKIGFSGLLDTVRIVFNGIVDIVQGAWKMIQAQFTGGVEGVRLQVQGVLQMQKGMKGVTSDAADSIVKTAMDQKQAEMRAMGKAVAAEAMMQAKEKTAEGSVASGTGAVNALDVRPTSGVNAPTSLTGGSGTGKGVTVGGGAGGGDRNISMNVTINMPVNVSKDVDGSTRDIADRVIGMLVNKLRDAEFSLG